MAYKRLFLDSDVLLDMFLKREPFFFHTQILLIECIKENIELRTSSLVIANIVYVLRKQVGILKAKENLKNLFNSAKVLPFEFDAIETAISSDITDFEDAIQFHIAQKHNCDAIITRNIKDYKNSTIPVLTAEQFLNTL
ncbi:Predicted nucleic acid-binding protein, contains PIN domain [Mucilaginibacter gossypiicola]|uniref:Predicted nucleic acid-binding protein, contains PIN domain n=1 Tax=Mucilaginibacter gossypiicola TaxID=551995 RepID=A0A1H8TQG2_9SPHI|nr:PIN domain-containing protein [Mucilaginibacter gossypiicola]SEO92854.1 Predicted nucleic acid-binding protein, contains PIN domain [Mucilaginibacter gossypiicola]